MEVVPPQNHIVVRSHFDHRLQPVELLEVPRFCPGNARVVTWQPHDGRRRDELRRKQDARHLLRMVRKRQRR